MSDFSEKRQQQGREMLDRVNPGAGDAMIEAFREIAPDFEQLLLGFVFADVFSRDVISLRERQLIRLGALVGLGVGPVPLRANIGSALTIGISREDVAEAFIQCLPYAGFPRVIDALGVLKQHFADEDAHA